ncbi:serine hydrolase [Nocardia sp. NPDC051570]|uniref:serine hydrolase n=1 Tax=Nocardia sp. NPDC051570 TaxID=3364324 RepID=UPI003791A43A
MSWTAGCRWRVWAPVLAGCVVALGFSGHLVTGTAHAEAPVAAPGIPDWGPILKPAAPQGLSPIALAQQMRAAIENVSPGTNPGIEVVDTATGTELASLNADSQFYTASVVKLLIAIDAADGQGGDPDPATAGQIRQMLSASDDSVADVLWDADGGDAIIDRMTALIGLPGTQPPDDPDQWGETRTTPRDIVTIYHYLTTAAPQPERDLVLGALGSINEVAADGTDQYFGIPAALPGTDWAVKPGWMSLDSSTTLNTTGLVGSTAEPLRYAVVILTSQPAGISWTTGGAALTAGVGVLRTTLGL